MQRFRQLEPSWLRNGQTTSLLESVIEKEDVRDDLGGILYTPPCAVRNRLLTVTAREGRGVGGEVPTIGTIDDSDSWR